MAAAGSSPGLMWKAWRHYQGPEFGRDCNAAMLPAARFAGEGRRFGRSRTNVSITVRRCGRECDFAGIAPGAFKVMTGTATLYQPVHAPDGQPFDTDSGPKSSNWAST